MEEAPDTSERAVRVAELLERVNEALALGARVEVEDDGEQLRARLVGEDLGLAIGRHGSTIDAIQHLARRVAGRGALVEVDAAGYRARRAVALARQADQAAEEAVRFGRPVALDAMTASERRLVHEHLRERGDVETHSEGEEPERHLVVTPPTS